MNSRAISTALRVMVPDPENGLPEEIFRAVTRLTPMINVDLLIKNRAGETLLTWREDPFFPPGWHVPGGIIRFLESMHHRMEQVAYLELGTRIRKKTEVIDIHEFIFPELPYRNHFISLLCKCTLKAQPARHLRWNGCGSPGHGQYAWFSVPPENMMKIHSVWRKWM